MAQQDSVMPEEVFWRIIQASLHGCEESYQDECLAVTLRKMQPDEIAEYVRHYEHFLAMANRDVVWGACLLLNGGYCSDDGFHDFRHWLISRGSEVYLDALQNPDSLADVEVFIDDNGNPHADYEDFGYIASIVYSEITNGGDIYEDYPQAFGHPDPEAEEWHLRDDDDEALKAKLPRLWSRFGYIKVRNDKDFEAHRGEWIKQHSRDSFDAPNIGLVRVNDTIYHKTYGKGVVQGIMVFNRETATADVQFGEEVHHMMLAVPDDRERLFSLTPFDAGNTSPTKY